MPRATRVELDYVFDGESLAPTPKTREWMAKLAREAP